MKKLLLMIVFLLLLPLAAFAETADSFPELLNFSQIESGRKTIFKNFYTRELYPDTANDAVDAEMKDLIDGMAAEGKKHIPKKSTVNNVPAWVDTGSTITRSGTQWLSFLTTSCVAYNGRQEWMACDVRTYDMLSGRQLLLGDIFPAESPVWDILGEGLRKQLSAFYEGDGLDLEALETLCTREMLFQTPFIANMASLTLYYHASALFPGKQTLVAARFLYSDIADYMNEAARVQTDNSRYKLIALTFDDGPARGTSANVVYQLKRYGANATFFCIGKQLKANQGILAYEQCAGNQIGSHNWQHDTYDYKPKQIADYMVRFDNMLVSLIGTKPTVIRAPGNHYQQFIKAQAGLPLFGWSLESYDVKAKDEEFVIDRVISCAQPGAVVLMHDINPLSREYLPDILQRLQQRGFVCVTLEEIYAAYGVELKADTLYVSCVEK